ncbi:MULTISPECIES: hypothetical protein [Bacteria]|uniref:hypothetical protein n=1 Tax=Bacteria TaxID=2 RepID=UPI003C7D8025
MRNPITWFVITAVLAIGSFVASFTIGFVAPLLLTAFAVLAAIIGIVVSSRPRAGQVRIEADAAR